MLSTQAKDAFLNPRTHSVLLTLFNCVSQVTGTGKTESNYEKEGKSIKYTQASLIKVMVSGGRLLLARDLVLQKKSLNLRVLIELVEFYLPKLEFTHPL